jgi:Protein of unknown function (DUF2637)
VTEINTEPVIRTAQERVSSSRTLGRASLVPTGFAAVMGWSASFIGLHGFAVRTMAGFTADTAWLVPGAFDLSAFGSTILVYRASINGRSGSRARLMMYLFTALSAWINWIHQTDGSAKFVACVLPVAAVLVFDGLAAEYRSDWEADHGRKAFRLRIGLLLLRFLADRRGTWAGFTNQITSIPVSSLVGLGADLAATVPDTQDSTSAVVPAGAALSVVDTVRSIYTDGADNKTLIDRVRALLPDVKPDTVRRAVARVRTEQGV